jgi:23S rRNA (adenine2503-C2)-methyltransferase
MAGSDAMTAADQLIVTAPATDRVNLLGLTRQQLESFFIDLGEKRFRAQQVMKWIHHRGVKDFAEMTDLSQPLRARLAEIAEIIPPSIAEQHDSQDGTRKWAIAVEGGSLVEAVLIPEGDRATLCVSSQVGCSSGLHVLFHRKQGFQRDLTAAEIIGQVWLAINSYDAWQSGKGRVVTNVVMMGMGEPCSILITSSLQ